MRAICAAALSMMVGCQTLSLFPPDGGQADLSTVDTAVDPACACVWPPPDTDMGLPCQGMCFNAEFHLFDRCGNLLHAEPCVHGCSPFSTFPLCY
jgi:hypothetical protein